MKPRSPFQRVNLAAACASGLLSACATPKPEAVDSGEPQAAIEQPDVASTAAAEKPASAESSWEEKYAALLEKYVAPGGVRYAAWKANPGDLASLRAVVDAIASTSPSGSEEEKLAYYLNAYNAWILHLVLEDYPVKGVGGGHALGRSAFFGRASLTVGGKKMSFNDLEHETIRKDFKEPRVHFALNCASAGCPPLMDRPFRASTLDSDLTRLARAFVNQNPEGVREKADGTYSLSEIFSWFKEDFGDVVTFINRYRDDPIPAGAKTEFHDYDWSLNEA